MEKAPNSLYGIFLAVLGIISLVVPIVSLAQESIYQQYVLQVNQAHDKALLTAKDPFVVDQLHKEGNVLIKSVCKKPKSKLKGQERKQCEEKLGEVFRARLSEVYFVANVQNVENYCKAHPVECESNMGFEKVVRKSHNDGVELSRQQKLQYLQVQYQAAMQQNALARQQALQRIGQALMNSASSLNQVFHPGGQRVPSTQHCQSRPDGFGGWRTECY